ncbi:hypothetical protein D3C73_1112340 [compost metagenome]
MTVLDEGPDGDHCRWVLERTQPVYGPAIVCCEPALVGVQIPGVVHDCSALAFSADIGIREPVVICRHHVLEASDKLCRYRVRFPERNAFAVVGVEHGFFGGQGTAVPLDRVAARCSVR